MLSKYSLYNLPKHKQHKFAKIKARLEKENILEKDTINRYRPILRIAIGNCHTKWLISICK